MITTPTIFLRIGCILPDGLRLKQQPFDNAWMSVETPAQLDAAVRDAGWHFMWIESACSRLGCGRTDKAAATRAIVRALKQTSSRFNAAELDIVHVSHRLGVHVARATSHTRHIQERASLGLTDEIAVRELAPE